MTIILKMISSSDWCAYQESSLRVYRAFVRSRIDYGAIVYSSAPPAYLRQLEPAANDVLRLASRMFKSTQIPTLQNICSERPLDLRRQSQSLKYYFKTRIHIAKPAFEYAVNTNY